GRLEGFLDDALSHHCSLHGLENAVVLEDFADARPLAEDIPHLVLARDFFYGLGDDVVLDRRGHDDTPVRVGDDQVAVRYGHATDGDRAPDRDHLEAALGVGGREPGGEDRKLHLLDAPAVPAEAVDHHSATTLGAGMRAQQLAPERGSNLGLHRGDDHLTLTKAIEHLHQKVVGLGGQLADLDQIGRAHV